MGLLGDWNRGGDTMMNRKEAYLILIDSLNEQRNKENWNTDDCVLRSIAKEVIDDCLQMGIPLNYIKDKLEIRRVDREQFIEGQPEYDTSLITSGEITVFVGKTDLSFDDVTGDGINADYTLF